jgi:hypothetical protein
MDTTATDPEASLLRPPEPGRFDPAELDGLPEPVRRHLTQAVAPGTPLHTSARLRMRGSIKVGRWLPFRAREVLNPQHGFVWTARAAGPGPRPSGCPRPCCPASGCAGRPRPPSG